MSIVYHGITHLFCPGDFSDKHFSHKSTQCDKLNDTFAGAKQLTKHLCMDETMTAYRDMLSLFHVNYSHTVSNSNLYSVSGIVFIFQF